MRGFRAKIINRSYKPPPRVGWLWFVDQWSAIGTETGADLLVFCIKYVRNIWAAMDTTSEKVAKNQVIGPLDSVVKFGKNCGLKLVNPEVIVLGFSSNSSIGWRFYSVTCAGWNELIQVIGILLCFPSKHQANKWWFQINCCDMNWYCDGCFFGCLAKVDKSGVRWILGLSNYHRNLK